MKNIKNERGSLALFVSIAMLFFMSFILAIYISTTTEQKTQLAVTGRIKSVYEQDLANVTQIYNGFIGTDENIPIYTAEQLKKIGTGESVYIDEVQKYYIFNLNSKYILKSNIDLNKYTIAQDNTITFTTTNQWQPIGTSTNPFTGIFDGNNYKIGGLYISDISKSNQALFAYNNGTIKNVLLNNGYLNSGSYLGSIVSQNLNSGIIDNCTNMINVTSKGNAGGICAYNNGIITNCSNFGNVITSNNSASEFGGICASMQNNFSKVENCINKGNITGIYKTGGIVGSMKTGGTVQNCVNSGIILSSGATNSDSGGIVGLIENSGTANIKSCYNSNKVTGVVNIGGIVGRTQNTNATIQNCYNNGTIENMGTAANNEVKMGGICGQADNAATITRCYNVGNISGTGSLKGAILGTYIADTLSYCYYLTGTATYGTNQADVANQTESKTAEQMKTTDFLALLNNETTNWKLVSGVNNGYPILSWQN